MPKARKKPPSRERYEREHPNVSVRVSKELKDVVDSIKGETGNSYAEIIKAGLTSAKDLWKKGREKGYKEGWEAAKRNYRIWYNCNVCGEEISILPNSDSHKVIIQCIKELRWGHSECH